jgi:hypothetical protein
MLNSGRRDHHHAMTNATGVTNNGELMTYLAINTPAKNPATAADIGRHL